MSASPPDKTSDAFDFSIVMSDEELERQKRLALNLQGLARKMVDSIDAMRSKRDRHVRRAKVSTVG